MRKILKFYFRKFRVKNIRRKSVGHKKYLQHKENARLLVQERITYFNVHYNFKFKRIAIRNQRGRWGSCSSFGNLNFNYKIVLLPFHLADYIIVHELCHLGEFSHSQKFWDLVAQKMPNHIDLKEELRKIKISW